MSNRNYPKVVCAAIRATNGDIIAGPRHYDEFMIKQIKKDRPMEFIIHRFRFLRLLGFRKKWPDAEQGFIDANGNFLSREEAYIIAKDKKQIKESLLPGLLHSEDLY